MKKMSPKTQRNLVIITATMAIVIGTVLYLALFPGIPNTYFAKNGVGNVVLVTPELQVEQLESSKIGKGLYSVYTETDTLQVETWRESQSALDPGPFYLEIKGSQGRIKISKGWGAELSLLLHPDGGEAEEHTGLTRKVHFHLHGQLYRLAGQSFQLYSHFLHQDGLDLKYAVGTVENLVDYYNEVFPL